MATISEMVTADLTKQIRADLVQSVGEIRVRLEKISGKEHTPYSFPRAWPRDDDYKRVGELRDYICWLFQIPCAGQRPDYPLWPDTEAAFIQQTEFSKSKGLDGGKRPQTDKWEWDLWAYDLKEGFNGGEYGRVSALTTERICMPRGEDDAEPRKIRDKRTGEWKPLTKATVDSAYKRAFELITGFKYSPERWGATVARDCQNALPPRMRSNWTVKPSKDYGRKVISYDRVYHVDEQTGKELTLQGLITATPHSGMEKDSETKHKTIRGNIPVGEKWLYTPPAVEFTPLNIQSYLKASFEAGHIFDTIRVVLKENGYESVTETAEAYWNSLQLEADLRLANHFQTGEVSIVEPQIKWDLLRRNPRFYWLQLELERRCVEKPLPRKMREMRRPDGSIIPHKWGFVPFYLQRLTAKIGKAIKYPSGSQT